MNRIVSLMYRICNVSLMYCIASHRRYSPYFVFKLAVLRAGYMCVFLWSSLCLLLCMVLHETGADDGSILGNDMSAGPPDDDGRGDEHAREPR